MSRPAHKGRLCVGTLEIALDMGPRAFRRPGGVRVFIVVGFRALTVAFPYVGHFRYTN
jgi:hypothetical protein